MKLVENVKVACDRAGITVSELEKRAGLAENAVYKWDRHSPGVDKVKRAASVLGIPMDELTK